MVMNFIKEMMNLYNKLMRVKNIMKTNNMKMIKIKDTKKFKFNEIFL
jgi:hypothetical protein